MSELQIPCQMRCGQNEYTALNCQYDLMVEGAVQIQVGALPNSGYRFLAFLTTSTEFHVFSSFCSIYGVIKQIHILQKSTAVVRISII